MDATTVSPSKRRALGPRDANALPSPRSAAAAAAGSLLKPHHHEASPLRKRAVEAAAAASMALPPAKRACIEVSCCDVQTRPMILTCGQDTSGSPNQTPHATETEDDNDDEEEDESSVFDGDASWASNTTPDVSPAPRVLTREQAREVRPHTITVLSLGSRPCWQSWQKAEILRLRLGLASYKVRTGQTSVPLADLVAKPLPRRASNTATTTATKSPRRAVDDRRDKGTLPEKKESEQQGDVPQQEEDDSAMELPPLRDQDDAPAGVVGLAATPRGKDILRMAEEDEGRLTSSALRGGAVSGLLSLARGGSDE
jgi:hypothetical protein